MCHYAREIVHAMIHGAALELLIYGLIVTLERERVGGGVKVRRKRKRERERGERVVYRGKE